TMQTIWHRTGNEAWLRLTKFFGTLFLINFAIGVATGLVQEFEFGMNWSVYSKFVGNVFGAPLAIEGLAAFFLEATFLGLWIFGWNRLSPRVHLATIWIAALGTWLSGYFILVANSWMQHPVGYKIVNGEAQLTSVWKLLSNMATGSFSGQVQGLNQLQAEEQSTYGSGNYMPNVRVIYWSMRVMAYMGVLMFLVSALGAWLYWKRKLETARWFHRTAIA